MTPDYRSRSCLGYIMALDYPAGLLNSSFYTLQSSNHRCFHFSQAFCSTFSNQPTQLAPWASFLPSYPKHPPKMNRKIIESCIGASVIFFVTQEIEDYANFSDQYPTACKAANFLALFAFTLLHSIYRNPQQQQSNGSHSGQVQATGDSKGRSL